MTDLVHELGLSAHPEGGWYRQTWVAQQSFHPEGYPAPRRAASLIHFLLRPGEVSRWHTVRSDEVWLHHLGGPLQLHLGGSGSRPDPDPQVSMLGPDVAAGQSLQLLVPGGEWQLARNHTDDDVLVSCVVAPGFDFADFRLLPR